MENHLSLIRIENNYVVHFRVALNNYERLVLEERKRRKGFIPKVTSLTGRQVGIRSVKSKFDE